MKKIFYIVIVVFLLNANFSHGELLIAEEIPKEQCQVQCENSLPKDSKDSKDSKYIILLTDETINYLIWGTIISVLFWSSCMARKKKQNKRVDMAVSNRNI